VESGQTVDLSCAAIDTRLWLPDGDMVSFHQLCGYQASVKQLGSRQLPGSTTQARAGLEVDVRLNGQSVSGLPKDSWLTLVFATDQAAQSGIAYWNGDQWYALHHAGGPVQGPERLPADPKHPQPKKLILISAHPVGDTLLQVTLNFSGIFALLDTSSP
jgi:hypothetical protein